MQETKKTSNEKKRWQKPSPLSPNSWANAEFHGRHFRLGLRQPGCSLRHRQERRWYCLHGSHMAIVLGDYVREKALRKIYEIILKLVFFWGGCFFDDWIVFFLKIFIVLGWYLSIRWFVDVRFAISRIHLQRGPSQWSARILHESPNDAYYELSRYFKLVKSKVSAVLNLKHIHTLTSSFAWFVRPRFGHVGVFLFDELDVAKFRDPLLHLRDGRPEARDPIW